MSKKTTKARKSKGRDHNENEIEQLKELIQWPKGLRPLFRPGRKSYILGVRDPKNCVFCASLSQGLSVETLVIHCSAHSMVVLNKYPYNTGHLLVLPQKHLGTLTGLPPEVFSDLHELLRVTVKIVEEAYRPAGINVGLNLGKAAGAGIPEHIHYHIVPRWDGDLNFFPLVAQTKTIIQSLEETYQHLLPYFSALKK